MDGSETVDAEADIDSPRGRAGPSNRGASGVEPEPVNDPVPDPDAPHSDTPVAADVGDEDENAAGRPGTQTDGRGGVDESVERDDPTDANPPHSNGGGPSESADAQPESENRGGSYRRFAPHTRRLRFYARWWLRWRADLQALRQQAGYDVPDVDIEDVQRLKARWGRRAKRQLIERHPLGPWLDGLPGLAGPTTAYLVGIIGDPWRFPGQPCTAADPDHGWFARPVYDAGDPCPMNVSDPSEPYRSCGAPLREPRRGTGVRALYSYFGLDGKTQKRKGESAGYRTRCKGLILNPDGGLSDQIVRQKPEPYRTTYDDEKGRLKRERGYRSDGERVEPVDVPDESETSRDGLPPLIYLDKVARTIAAKAFVGDLLMEWKERQPLGSY